MKVWPGTKLVKRDMTMSRKIRQYCPKDNWWRHTYLITWNLLDLEPSGGQILPMYYIVYIISYLVVFFVLVNAAKELRNLHQNSFTILMKKCHLGWKKCLRQQVSWGFGLRMYGFCSFKSIWNFQGLSFPLCRIVSSCTK